MAVIFPKTMSAGERVGNALGQVGQGIGSGLQALANMKMQDYMQRQQMGLQREQQQWQQQQMEPHLQQLFGEQGSALAHTPANIQTQWLKNMQRSGAQQQQQQATEQALISQGIDPQVARQVSGSPQMGLELLKQQDRTKRGELFRQALSGTQGQPGAIPEGMSPKEYLDLGKYQQRERGLNIQEKHYATEADRRKQEHIAAQAKPFIDSYRNKRDTMTTVLNDALRLKELLQTGKVAHDITEWQLNNLPLSGLNAETQEFLSKAGQLVGAMTESSRGAPTQFKLKFNERNKPTLMQHGQVQFNIVEDLINDASKMLAADDLTQKMIEENDYDVPKGLEQKVLKSMHEYNKSGKPYFEILQGLRGIEQRPQELPQQGNQQPMTQQPPTEQQPKPFGQGQSYLASSMPEEGGEGILPATGRILGRGAAAVGGIPHSLTELTKAAYNVGNWATGGKLPDIEKFAEKIPVGFPSYEDIKGGIESKTGSSLEAKGPIEEGIAKVIEFFAPAITPVPYLGAMKPMQALKAAAGAEAARFAAQNVGFGQIGQETFKIGGAIVGAMAGNIGDLKSLMRNNYEMAPQILSEVKVPAAELRNVVNKAPSLLTEAVAKRREDLIDVLKEIDQSITGDVVDAGRLTELKKSLNDTFSKNKSAPERRVYKTVSSALDSAIESAAKYGPKYKDAVETYKSANDLYKGFNAGGKLHEMAQGADKYVKSHLLQTLLGLGTSIYKFGTPYTAGGATSAYVVGEAIKAFSVMGKSVTARKYYGDILKDSLAGNAKAFRKHVEQLDNEMIKLEKKQPRF